MSPRVLIGCEFSGIVRQAFEKLGWYAVSCDLLDTEIPGNHYKGDIRDIINDGWDLAIFHPPCTFLANSGVQWLYNKDGMIAGANFFRELWDADIEHICMENPIQHKHARVIIDAPYEQIIQPWQFGHGETKATCLWLKNLPRLQPTNIVHRMAPSKERSRTYQGIADAMATQFTEC